MRKLMWVMLLGACGGGSTPVTQPMPDLAVVVEPDLAVTPPDMTILPDMTKFPAKFFDPTGIAVDSSGTLYVADTFNQTIRQEVIAMGQVTTLAGSVGSAGFMNGTGSAATFDQPSAVAFNSGNLYVADTMNGVVRKVVVATGVVSAFPSSGDGGSTLSFDHPQGIAVSLPTLFVANTNNQTIQQVVINSGVETLLAGSAGNSGSTDASGSSARFNQPTGLAYDRGNLYVADRGNYTIRQIIVSSGAVSTVAGSTGVSGYVDASGVAAQFDNPIGLAADGIGNLYVADCNNNAVRAISLTTGAVTTLAGGGASGSSDGTGTAATFNCPSGISYSGGELYVTDSNNEILRKIDTASQAVTTIAGAAGQSGSDDGPY